MSIQQRLRSIPWWIWVGLAPALLIALNEVRKGGRERVELVVAGPFAALEADDAPPNARYSIDAVESETGSQTVRRAEQKIDRLTYVLVIAPDPSAVLGSAETLAEWRTQLSRFVAASSTLVPVTVLIHPDVAAPEGLEEAWAEYHEWWRSELCRSSRHVMCVEVDPSRRIGEQIGPTVASAVENLFRLRAETRG